MENQGKQLVVERGDGGLALGRRPGEGIVLFDAKTREHIATVRLDRIKGLGQVQLSVFARRNVRIFRNELIEFRGDYVKALKDVALALLLAGAVFSAPPALAQAEYKPININKVIEIESGGNPRAKSWCGARGLMQITPPALADFNAANDTDYNVDDLYNPKINVAIGTWYFLQIDKWLTAAGIARSNGNRIIAYNWGIGNLKKWHKAGREWKRLPVETRVYLRKY